jgi:RimJ/RimL family protein N-acetyltransferase
LNDVDGWIEFHASAEAIRFFGYPLNDKELVTRIIERQVQRYQSDRSGLRAVMLRGRNEMIGLCGLLTQMVNDTPELEIGYQFLPRFWGNGYATESAKKCKEIAFNGSTVSSIISIIHPDNLPSQRVAERNGMRMSGKTTWYEMSTDIWRISRDDRQYIRGE